MGNGIGLSSPLTEREHARRRHDLAICFPQLTGCGHGRFLSLWQYVAGVPERFYSREAFGAYLSFLEGFHAADRQGLALALEVHGDTLDLALSQLRELGTLPWHDAALPSADIDAIRFIDRHVHPAYVRALEGVFVPLGRIVAERLRLERGKEAAGLELHQIVDETSRVPALRCLTAACHTLMRNAISHGGVRFGMREVTYHDGRGTEVTRSSSSILDTFDDLLDTCAGMALALRVFLATHAASGYATPRAVLLDELRAEVATRWWSVDACLAVRLGPRTQLVLYASALTRHYVRLLWSAVHSATLAEALTPGYDRYLISVRLPGNVPGCVAFVGPALRHARETGGAADLREALETVFFGLRCTHSRTAGWLELLADWRWLAHAEWGAWRQRVQGTAAVTVRGVSLHRNHWGTVLRGSLVMPVERSDKGRDAVRCRCRAIVRAAHRAANRELPRASPLRLLPLGWAQVGVYARDHRARRLASFGLGVDLVCTVRFSRMPWIRCPDLYQGEAEQVGAFRVVWNRAWLDSMEA
jgi:hypothetical protein